MKIRSLLLCLFLALSQFIQAQTFDANPVFEENFSGKHLDKNAWGIDLAEFKGHNVFFTNKNHSIKNGILTLKLKKQKYKNCSFTSTSIWTNPKMMTFGYGKLLIRARIPATKECRPAMWLKAKNSDKGVTGEIDLLEHWPAQNATTYQANFHLWGKLSNATLGKHQQYPMNVKENDITQWHVYSVEILKDSIIMKVDDRHVAQWNRKDLPNWPNNIQYQLYLSLACSTWATDHVKESKNLPQVMQIDWVKYYKIKK